MRPDSTLPTPGGDQVDETDGYGVWRPMPVLPSAGLSRALQRGAPTSPVSGGSSAPRTRSRPSIGDDPAGGDPAGGGSHGSTFAGSTWLGGNQIQVQGVPVWTAPGLWEITMTVPETGLVELALLYVPSTHQPASTPLLVVFHKFGASHWDTYYNTSFLQEAMSRNWFLIAPLSSSSKHFNNTPGQIHTKALLDFVLSYFPQVDKNRVYGVGFSMGGGALMGYAARHLDPSSVLFAAIVDHTGGGALWHTYGNEPDDDDADDDIMSGQHLEVPDILDYWYGGSPTQFPFVYQSHSVMDIDPWGNIGLGTNQIVNLKHVPIYLWMSNEDPLTYLIAQTLSIHNYFLALGGVGMMTTVAGRMHSWSTLDETVVCDWLAQHTLQVPSSGSALLHEDGIHFFFDVKQDAPGAFTAFDWSIDATQNLLTVSNTSNLNRIIVDTVSAGLDPVQTLLLDIESADASGDEVRFTGVAQAPTGVLRDNQPESNWAYDAQTRTLTITESDGPLSRWTIVYN